MASDRAIEYLLWLVEHGQPAPIGRLAQECQELVDDGLAELVREGRGGLLLIQPTPVGVRRAGGGE